MSTARPGPTIQLPRSVVAALCAALVLALVTVAFLLGRQSARPAPQALAASVQPEHEVSAPVQQDPPEGSQAAAPDPTPWSEAAPEVPRDPHPVFPAPAAEPDERAAVAAYFVQLDQVEAAVKTWSDPQQLALQLVQQATQGDRRGLDELAAGARRARETLRNVAVPAACREHHAEAQALLDAAVDLLGRLGPALSSQDFVALQGLTDAGQALETRTKRLQTLESELRSRYGLPTTTR